MKTLYQLEQEAKEARDDVALALAEVLPYGTGSVIADKLILASVAMVTYQFALGMQEVSGDGRGEALPEVRQEERDSDGWIEWNGEAHDCPMSENVRVEARFANGDINGGDAGQYRWHHVGNGYDLIAYRIVK